MFIDAAIIYGQSKPFTVSIQVRNEDDTGFVPFDLSEYSIYFRILGSTTHNAKPLVEHLITQDSELDEDGAITNAVNGEFTFNVTAEDTITVGLGVHPIEIEIVDIDTLETEFILTEGGLYGEFNKIHVVQV